MTDEGFGYHGGYGESRTTDDEALDAVSELIRKLQPGSMVQRFVLLVETIDNEDRWFSAFTAPAQKPWDSLGLLKYGLATEVKWVQDEEQDEDD